MSYFWATIVPTQSAAVRPHVTPCPGAERRKTLAHAKNSAQQGSSISHGAGVPADNELAERLQLRYAMGPKPGWVTSRHEVRIDDGRHFPGCSRVDEVL
jgi:hypothetical protein